MQPARDKSPRFWSRAYVEATAVPPQKDWGSFGRSLIVPPLRVTEPGLIQIGDRVLILENCWMSLVCRDGEPAPILEFGDDVKVGRGCQFSVTGRVSVGDRVIIGDFTQIGDTFHPFEARVRVLALTAPAPVTVGAQAVIASNVTVLPGVTIGAGAVVDHHSVVTSDVGAGAHVSGNPARPR